jgi:surface antigen
MLKCLSASLLIVAALGFSPALAETRNASAIGERAGSGSELPPYLQCVPYARDVSGIQIYGDAHTWWGQAEGRYERGRQPKVGAVMAFRPAGNMVLGHVAAVTKVVDNRTVLLDHANWSPIDGRRGQIERGVKAVDVSPNNDWSQVRVWYAPLGGLGTTAWPVEGFIYGKGAAPRRPQIAAGPAPRPVAPDPAPARTQASREFSQAFAALDTPSQPRVAQAVAQRPQAQPTRVASRAVTRPATRSTDPLDAVVRRYEN